MNKITSTEFVIIPDYENYEISMTGIVRSVDIHNVKRTTHDCKGRKVIILYDNEGRADSFYLSQLVKDVFGTDISEVEELKSVQTISNACNLNPKHGVNNLFSLAKGTSETAEENNNKSKRKKILCETTGQVYPGYSALAKAFNWKYDKIYDAFYYSKNNSIEFDGYVLTKLD